MLKHGTVFVNRRNEICKFAVVAPSSCSKQAGIEDCRVLHDLMLNSSLLAKSVQF